MSSELATAFHALTDRLVQLVDQDAVLRESLNNLALKLLLATEMRENPGVQREIEEKQTGTPPAADGSSPKIEEENKNLRALTLGSALPAITEIPGEKPRHRLRSIADEDLDAIEARSRLKAEAMRWASTRRQLLDNDANHRDDIAPGDRDILDRAKKLSDCYLWMCTPGFRAPEALTLLDNAARCFDLLADAVGLTRKVLGDREIEKEFLRSVMEVVAYAQSALRVAVASVFDRADSDQISAYEWLRSTANNKEMFLMRHMRLDDPADPSSLDEIALSLANTEEEIADRRRAARRKRACLAKLRYHAKLIAEHGETVHDRQSIIESVEALLREGVPHSNVEIRDSLLPIIGQAREGNDLPQGYSLVLREITRYMDSDDEAWDRSPDTAIDEQIERVATLLGGQTAMLIGGEIRPHALAAIKSALRLKELIWVGVDDIQSVTDFEPYVARPEVTVVLLAIRWSRHSFGEVSKYCDRHGKPFVRLPGGYSPRQLSSQILAQCGDRLARALQ
jgi:hypothetical protein